MKLALFALFAWSVTSLAVNADPIVTLSNFELTDQEAKPRVYRFPKNKVTVMTLADQKGSDQLTPWIQSTKDRYGTRVDIDGIADMSTVPGFLQNTIRKAFRKKLTYSVMLDWEGNVVKQFAYKDGVANIYVIDPKGRIVARASGPMTESGLQSLFKDIDRTIAGAK